VVARAVEQSRDTVELGRDEANKGLENIGARVVAANKAAEVAAQIAVTSAQQLAGMEQVNQAVMSINAAGNQSVSGTRQVEKEVERLQALARDLGLLFEHG
jgi:methyl-accepting chemotaxis protein